MNYAQPVISYNNPLLEVNFTGYSLTAGAENEVSISVKNIGKTSAFDVKAALIVPSTVSGISIVKESYARFDVIHYEETAWMYPVLYVESSCPLGAYSLTLELEYSDESDAKYADSAQIGVAVDSVEPTERTRIAIQSFKITPVEVFVGDEFTLEMDLKNWGANAHDVQVQLVIDSQSPFVSLDPSLVFVGDLRSNQTAKVIYDLGISGDADARLYALQLVISYYDVDDQSVSLSEVISIGVHSIVDFRLLDILPSIVTAEPGETVTIEADLLLLGTETVDFVEVEIVENRSIGPFSTVPESYEYIGRVDPDSPILFTIQFMVDPNATSGSYTLQLRVSCWDGYNQQRQATIELPVVVKEFSNQNEEASPTFWDVIWTILRILFGVKP
ncbi:MAG: COG1361 S-layer family protein [Candidatus Bathyarchaeia archaeon]